MTTRVTDLFLSGDHASRPVETAVPIGALYVCSTHGTIDKNAAGVWTTWATITGGLDAEAVRDTIGTALVAGTGITVTINDPGDTITIAATGTGGLDAEGVRDTIGAALVAGAGISITVNDAGDTITIAATGVGDTAETLMIALSDETTTITSGTAKVTFRMPFALNLTGVRASLTTASSSGGPVTVDINQGGASILSTKLTIDDTEKTSTTAAVPAVISDTALADDAEITLDIDTAGTGAKGLKVYLLGTR